MATRSCVTARSSRAESSVMRLTTILRHTREASSAAKPYGDPRMKLATFTVGSDAAMLGVVLEMAGELDVQGIGVRNRFVR
jgi:hypothetical protein